MTWTWDRSLSKVLYRQYVSSGPQLRNTTLQTSKFLSMTSFLLYTAENWAKNAQFLFSDFCHGYFFVSQDSLTGDKILTLKAILADFVLRNYKMVTQLGTLPAPPWWQSNLTLNLFFSPLFITALSAASQIPLRRRMLRLRPDCCDFSIGNQTLYQL